ncbi:MAG: DUF2586 domain-containing protein [Bacteroidetes bacterium]|nr:DUF2586 domain-containing protein [Bacteroidota bacterium]
MLSRVKIIFENGLLGSSSPMDDGVCGHIYTGVAVPGKLELNKPYLMTKFDALADFGVTAGTTEIINGEEVFTPDPNANMYKAVKEHYDIAPQGSKLYFMCVADTVKMSDMVDKTKSYGKKLVEYSNGAVRFLFCFKKDAATYTPTILDGLDEDVYLAATEAQKLGVHTADVCFAPSIVFLEGRHFNGVPADLKGLHQGDLNRVGILIGDTVCGSNGATLGTLSGTLASIPVQRSIARVRSGALPVSKLYIQDKMVEDADVEVIHDKGFITFRTFVGKAGYFFSDDKLATKVTDDYALIPRRRIVDKAYRIGYITLLEELNEELPVDDKGRIPAPIAKSIQNSVERAIMNNMTAYRNLGNDPSDPNDTGVECYIDTNQNVVATSQLDVRLRVKPYAYPKYIDCYLGFKVGQA